MKYYTKKSKNYGNLSFKNRKLSYKIIILIMIIILFNSILYLFNKRILPIVLNIGEIKMKSEVTNIINEESVKIYGDNFNYEDIIKIEKDTEGNITMIRTDTIQQNYLASQVALSCNKKIQELEDLGIDVPLGYLTNNVMFYKMGPKITVKMQQVGNITTKYESVFESAGINQTRHKIYLDLTTTIRVVVPFHSKDVEVTSQIPISDTIIVGKIPDTAINMNEKR